MGLSPFRPSPARGGSYTPPPAPNPNPRNYQLREFLVWQNCVILKLKYPDATTYEGVKLLLFARGVTVEQVLNQGWIDPHFSKGEGIYPVARFEPTQRGYNMAKAAAEFA